MRKAILPLVASLALCGTATAAVIATNASAQSTAGPRRPVMLAMATAPSFAAMTAAPRGEGGAPSDAMREERRGQFCQDFYAHEVGAMAYLETRLALTPAQQPLFARWKDVKLDMAKHRQDECGKPHPLRAMMRDGKRPSVTDRMAREEDMLKARLASLEAERPALDALYNSLNAEQKQAVERGAMMRRHMMMGMMAGMGRMGHGPMGHGPMDRGAMGGPADAPPPPAPQ